ncbi:N-acetylmuramoyl-L-alanine amidase [Xanthomonas perforans]|nr:N-acetylmuramoyl-L-alanine amidase [Xanthomonas perforans]MBZ3359653.1 N-acetylmuramoyl-L-alanine amidase [Xanthomonas perforans]MBZ3390692.1 N-acetylmuramoyl-L-alanine amidase [Xanthomonas perforans]MBZ3536151.1 N-acetylmuramoyl-L-alanine amidase [Xanthomonas perforans]MBZ3545010.1 N-acetylmuramoyl-L-alanine amidase [Xanthomonas perforans]
MRPAEDPLPLLLLAAGHGLYIKHIGTNSEWSYQRDAKNGMLEDKTTPGYATAVNSALTANGSQVNTALVRSESTAIHTPSGKPWWEVSAKYYLMDLLPDQSKIWASIPNDKTSVEREKNEDIRSRPLYGNYLKASYGLNIHTNAENSGKIRGTIGFYQPNHPFSEQSKLLTSKVVFSMKEIINSDAAYEQWDVDTAPRGEDKGENRVANYPSTIIEVGFHTNAADAIALQNTKFRTLASKGMAKGVKLYKEGKECAPFKIDSIPTVSGPIGTPFDYKINYSGNPAFPVKMYFEVVSCQSGWSCSGGTRTVNVVSSPLTFQISCTGKTTAGTFVYRRWLEDADGVKTAPVDHTYSCVPPKSKMASPVIADESIGITNS